jgi:hypothetical protein
VAQGAGADASSSGTRCNSGARSRWRCEKQQWRREQAATRAAVASGAQQAAAAGEQEAATPTAQHLGESS